MKIKIEITCDNAAFERNASAEVKRILQDYAGYKIDTHYSLENMDGDKLRDVNGNTVGLVTVTEDA